MSSQKEEKGKIYTDVKIIFELVNESNGLDQTAIKNLLKRKLNCKVIDQNLTRNILTIKINALDLKLFKSFVKDEFSHKRLNELKIKFIQQVISQEECIYHYVPHRKFIKPEVDNLSIVQMKELASNVQVLFLTVNDWERTALLAEIKSINNKNELLRGKIKEQIYRIGFFGSYCVAQVDTSMGSTKPRNATITIMDAVNELENLKVVFLIGIAYGLNKKNQRLGDVLVAESIFPYENQKLIKNDNIYRGDSIPAGANLCNVFRSYREDWQEPLYEGRLVAVHQGQVLSGEKLVNDPCFVSKVKTDFPVAIGGEMEGVGGYNAVSSPREVILVKSICDWADGDKDDHAQPFAAFTAVSLTKHILSIPDVLNPPITSTNTGKIIYSVSFSSDTEDDLSIGNRLFNWLKNTISDPILTLLKTIIGSITLILEGTIEGYEKLKKLLSEGLSLETFGYKLNAISSPLCISKGYLELVTRDIKNSTRYINLPLQNPFFTGREDILGQIAQLLREHKLLTILGKDGIGKSQTALEFCYIDNHYYQTIFWIKAQNKFSFDSSYFDIVRCLKLEGNNSDYTQPVNFGQTTTLVKNWLSTNSGWLMVLDGLEDYKLVNQYLPSHHEGHILITSSQSSGDFGKTITLEEMDLNTALLFFLRKAGLIGEKDALDKVSQEAIKLSKQILKYLGGLPLVIEQAAVFLSQPNLGEKTLMLGSYIDIINVLTQQKFIYSFIIPSLSASLGSVDNQSEVALKLLQICSLLSPELIPEEILANDYFLESLTEVKPKSENFLVSKLFSSLQILADYSLIEHDRDKKIISVHPLIQSYILGLMSPDVKQSLAELLVTGLQSMLPKNPQDPSDWSQYRKLLPHILSLSRVIDPELVSDNFIKAARLFSLVGVYCGVHNLFKEARILFFLSLNIRKKITPADFSSIAHCQVNMGISFYHRGQYAKALSYIQEALSAYQRVPYKFHSNIAACQVNMGNIYNAQNNYPEAENFYQKALSIYRKYPASVRKDLSIANCFNNLGDIHRKLGNYDKAIDYFNKALYIREEMLAKNPQSVAETLANIGIIYSLQGKYDEALDYGQRALSIRVRVFGESHPDVANSLDNLGIIYDRYAKYKEALDFYQKALSIRELNFGTHHPIIVNSLNNIGGSYARQAQYGKALEFYEKALSMNKEFFVEAHSTTATTLSNIGLIYEKQGNYTQALDYYNQALSIREEIFTQSDHLELGKSYNDIGSIYSQVDKYEQALNYYKKAFSINKNVFGGNNIYLADILGNMANVYLKQKNSSMALENYYQSLSAYKLIFGQNHLKVAQVLNNIASTHATEGKYEEAENLYLQSLKIKESILGELSPDVAETLHNLGILYELTSREVKAIDYYKQALAIYDRFFQKEDPRILGLLEVYSQLLLKLNRNDDARPLLDHISEANYGKATTIEPTVVNKINRLSFNFFKSEDLTLGAEIVNEEDYVRL